MSVRMALAKLCACTCGGALIGTGAMQVSETPKPQKQIASKVQKKKARKRYAVRCVTKRTAANKRLPMCKRTRYVKAKKRAATRYAAVKTIKRPRRVVTTRTVTQGMMPRTVVSTAPRAIPMPPTPHCAAPLREAPGPRRTGSSSAMVRKI